MHTPGPWKLRETLLGSLCVDAGDRTLVLIQREEDKREVSGNVTTITRVAIPHADADARLIAAAPDMLAALRDIEMETRQGAQWTAAEINELVRAAIAKATGAA